MSTEKRYYQKKYDESYYVFDSKTLTEKEFEEKVEYEGYNVFADSLTPEEIINLLNENEGLKRENEAQKENNKLYSKSQKYWFTESIKLTDKTPQVK